MPNRVSEPAAQPAPKSTSHARKRPTCNITTSAANKQLAEDTASEFGLFTAQGGDQRPRVSAVFDGFLAMLRNGQIDKFALYEAACREAGLMTEPEIEQRIKQCA